MPILDAANVARTVAAWMRQNTDRTAFTRPQLLAAAQAANQWLEDSIPSYRAALPAAFKAGATPEQEAEVLAFVLYRRIGKLRAEED